MMQTTRFVVFQLADFLLFFFSGKYLIRTFGKSAPHTCVHAAKVSGDDHSVSATTLKRTASRFYAFIRLKRLFVNLPRLSTSPGLPYRVLYECM